jgi:hypothetical protein
MDYLARCQYLLQQGQAVMDVAYWFGEGAPLSVDDMTLELPAGHDFDFCSSENVMAMRVEKGRLVLPSGASYRYLLLPDTDRMTLPLARKVKELANAGARLAGGRRPVGTPGLTAHPDCDDEIRAIAAALWDGGRTTAGTPIADLLAADRLAPDFEGQGLRFVHRCAGDTDVYFVANGQQASVETVCAFRVTGRKPELWNPETGRIVPVSAFKEDGALTRIPLSLGPAGSVFVVFRPGEPASRRVSAIRDARELLNFVPPPPQPVVGPWQVSFDPRWGGPAGAVAFDRLEDWSKRAEEGIRYYSGTATYRTKFKVPGVSNRVTAANEAASPSLAARPLSFLLDLGAVEVMARVRVNGKDCGIAWKPPYRVDISAAVREGANDLEIDIVNLWINRMIGDEQLPLDSAWKGSEIMLEWPEWFLKGTPRPSGRFTFTSCRHYKKDTPLVSSGLLGPVTIQQQ